MAEVRLPLSHGPGASYLCEAAKSSIYKTKSGQVRGQDSRVSRDHPLVGVRGCDPEMGRDHPLVGVRGQTPG